jgi:Citrate transporter
VAAAVLVVFALVYLAMLLGELPGLALDRTGAALLGAIVLVATELISPQQAWDAIDAPTLCLLFGLMVVSAQLRLGGFYDHLTRRVAEADLGPDALLALLVAVAGALSAVLANDIVCLAMAPVLIEGCLDWWSTTRREHARLLLRKARADDTLLDEILDSSRVAEDHLELERRETLEAIPVLRLHVEVVIDALPPGE